METDTSRTSPPQKAEKPILKFFASVKLTIFLLVFLALSSIVGTIIPQNQPAALYIQQYGYSVFKLLDTLSCLDLYHSGWFLLVLALLIVNLIVCTTDRLRHVWGIVFPKENQLSSKTVLARPGERKLTYQVTLDQVKTALRPALEAKLGSMHETADGTATILWQEKGRLSRLGVIVVHLSIVLFYIAGIASSIGGFRTSVELAEGQGVEQVRLPKANAIYDLGFVLRLDKFEAQFYPTGEPKEYRSDVTILEKDHPLFQAQIRVNDPLTYNGIAFYQATFGRFPKAVNLTIQDKTTGSTVRVSVPFGQPAKLPDGLGTLRSLRYESNVMDKGLAVQMVIDSPRTGQKDFWVFKNDPDFGRVQELPYRFFVDSVEEGYYTGLQVAKEPGIFFVWAGSILMVLGIAVTFFMSHRKIWAVLQKQGNRTTVTLGGQANKNKAGLDERLDKLYKYLQTVDVQAPGK